MTFLLKIIILDTLENIHNLMHGMFYNVSMKNLKKII